MRRAVALLLLSAVACSAESPEQHGLARGELPPGLREVSGLALASPRSVFAHDDEQAVIYEIELGSGRPLRRFALGNPPATGDFEGIADDGRRLFLITSTGRLLTAARENDRENLPFEGYETGIGRECEIEGMSLGPAPDHLLILCKRVRGRGPGRLLIFEWNRRTHVARPWRDIDLSPFLGRDSGQFAPSALEWVAERRELVILSAGDRRLLVLSEDGRLLGMARLAPSRHPQPEGVAVTPAGELVVADEGPRRAGGRLTVYPPAYLRQVRSRLDATASGVRTSAKNASR